MLAITTNESVYISDPSTLRRAPPSLSPASDIPSGSIYSTWSPDGTSLYLAFPYFINRYDAFGSLMKTVYSQDDSESPISSLIIKDKGSLIFATGNLVHILEHSASQTSSSKIVHTLPPHPDPNPVTALSLSNDGTVLVAASATAVVTHNLSLNIHTTLRGLKTTEEEYITSCVVHPHSRVRLFLGLGRDLIIYDMTRPTGPAKVIPLSEATEGHIAGISCSPYSKALLAVACSNGYVGLVDLDKEHGKIIRSFDHETPLTSVTFSLDGATLYMGTVNGRLLVQSLRAATEPAKTVTISESGYPVLGLVVSKKRSIKDSKPGTPAAVAASASAPVLNQQPRPLAQKDTNSPIHARRRETLAVKSPAGSANTSPVVSRVRTRVTSTVGSPSPSADSSTAKGSATSTPVRKRVDSTTAATKSRQSPNAAKETVPSNNGDAAVDTEADKITARRTRTISGNLKARITPTSKAPAYSKSPPPLPLPSASGATLKPRPSPSRGSTANVRTAKSSSPSAVAPGPNTEAIPETIPTISAPHIRTRPTSSTGRTVANTASGSSPAYKRTRTVSASSPKSPSSLTSGSQPSVRSRTLSTASTARTSVVSGPTKASITITANTDDDSGSAPKLRTITGSSSGSGTTASTGGTRSRTTSRVARSGSGGVTVARSGSPIPPVPPLPKNQVDAARLQIEKMRQGPVWISSGSAKTAPEREERTPSPDLPMPSPVRENLLDVAVGLSEESDGMKGMGILGLGTPEVERWIRAGQEDNIFPGEEKEDRKRVGFDARDNDVHEDKGLNQEPETSRLEDVDIDGEEDAEVQRRLAEHEQRLEEKSLTMQITPRRLGNPGAGMSSLPSPFMHLAAVSPHNVALPRNGSTSSGLNGVGGSVPGGGGAQGLLHALIQDAMVDFRQETKAEMVGLHLDLLRMGRAWRMEMRGVMEEYGSELNELKEENKKLKEENERLRRGY